MGFSSGGGFCPQGHWFCLETSFGCHTWNLGGGGQGHCHSSRSAEASPCSREFLGPRHQWCKGGEPWFIHTRVCVCLCVRTRTCIYTCECLFACVAGTSGFKSVHLTTPGIFHTRHKVFLWCVNSIPIGLLNHQVLSGRVCGTGSTRRCDRECAAVRLGTGGSSMMRNCSHGCLFCQYSS